MCRETDYHCTMKRIPYGYAYLALGVLGLCGGFVYWYHYGCTESCPIDSSWKLSMLRGGILGVSVAAIFHPSSRKGEADQNPQL
jgi:hypothetical protein